MNEVKINELKEVLKPLYQQLLDKTSGFPEKKFPFAVQWGQYYDPESGDGILFVGRATNEWHSVSDDLERLFGDPDSDDCIFNCSDQMSWVYDCWVYHRLEQQRTKYSNARSAFWRVIRSVAAAFYTSGKELNYVAWSNVCKIQRESGKNPTGRIFDLQIATCQRIFAQEIAILKPRIVVMFIGGYGKREILSYMNGGEAPIPIDIKEWDRYRASVYIIGRTIYICTEHPMCKPERPHIECLVNLIKQYR